MANKNIFITGATKNTGRAIAETFAKDGYDVIISSRDEASATTAAKEIEAAYGTKCMGVALDLTDVKDIERVFGEIEAAYGKLDTFVANSANLGVGKGTLNTTPEDFDDIMTVNARGTFFCCQAAAEIMKFLPDAVDLTGKTSLVQLVSVMALADAVLTNDSGPMHIAALANTRVFALFGPTLPELTGPYGTEHLIFKNEGLPCSGCMKRFCPKGKEQPCHDIDVRKAGSALGNHIVQKILEV